jgi:pimeloyl-ACP methyl ester carboxylesterase
MEEAFSFSDRDGRRISAVLARPATDSGKGVVLCHGLFGFKDSVTNRTLTRILNEQGVATLRFDFFGHGSSDGDLHDILLTTLVGQAESALDAMRARGCSNLGLFGASFGGMVALVVASRVRSLSALALRCPVADFPEILRQRYGRVAVELWRRIGTVPASVGRVPFHSRFYEDCLRYDAYKAATQVTAPTVVVHGTQDELIPLTQVQRLVDGLKPPKHLELISGADHRFSRASDFSRMTETLAAWLVRY